MVYTPLHTILCALDFEPGSGRALVQAAALAERGRGALHLVHAAPLLRLRGEADRAASLRDRARAFADATLGLDGAFDRLAPNVIEARGQEAADAILDAARDVGADLVVVGTHGRRGLGHLVLGSVAGEVVQRSPVPVWVVPEQGDMPGPGRPVVVAVDLSDATASLLRLGAGVARDHSTTVVPVYVRALPPEVLVGPAASLALARRSAEPMSRLDARAAMIEAIREAGVEVAAGDTYVIPGVPGRGVVDVAERARAGLVVMGTHGRRGLDRLRLGSVADYVLRHAPCPVLTVPVASAPQP